MEWGKRALSGEALEGKREGRKEGRRKEEKNEDEDEYFSLSFYGPLSSLSLSKLVDKKTGWSTATTTTPPP